MKLLYYTFLLFPFILFAQNPDSNRSKKVVFIIVDGISYDQLQTASTPNIDRISKAGNLTEAYVGGIAEDYRKTPTISAVGYNSLLTGTWANKHNVYGNSIKKPNYSYPSIFRLYKDYNPKGTIGVFSSWLDNRTKLVGDGLDATDRIRVDYSYDGLEYDSINYPHDKYRNFMKLIDVHVAKEASKTILEKAPDISWVYLEYSDDIGHGYGDGPYFNAAVTFEDGLIGQIYDAVAQRQKNTNEDWLFVVTTDHGRSAKDGKHHGGQSARERSTWILTNKNNTNSYFKNETPAIVDIYPTITDFLEINVPKNIKRELDGVSLLKPISAVNLSAKIKKDTISVTWKALENQQEKAKIYISTTNLAATKGTDSYTYLGEVELAKESYKTAIKGIESNFYKVVLETKTTTLNYWINK
ncbi:alkaline phosphatase family protein [Polaribacter vadi]|uniref:alkaline phosphatase family protein n=1 Tax=Polaribacter TaxID=52959 RepID=UPI001C0806A0|nr:MULTISPECIES: alkaline phosphatase family protein [Polaribacter]MBU3012256.1 alkaline phosphatase family protein [Polaribacter vadi]MDO6742073.1 alkaline phosphatase family protein [Polaribacter sp. 1_MG-2023]